MAVVVRPWTLAPLLYRDGARRVFATRQTLLAPSAKRREVFGGCHEGRAYRRGGI